MAHGKARHLWQHTSSILAMLVNVNRGSKDDPFAQPEDFDPYAEKKPVEPDRVRLRDLKGFFKRQKDGRRK